MPPFPMSKLPTRGGQSHAPVHAPHGLLFERLHMNEDRQVWSRVVAPTTTLLQSDCFAMPAGHSERVDVESAEFARRRDVAVRLAALLSRTDAGGLQQPRCPQGRVYRLGSSPVHPEFALFCFRC